MAKVLVSPFQWGLGHAMRDIPIIEEFLRRGHEVEFAADGRAEVFLKKRYPDLVMHHLPDLPMLGTESKFFVYNIVRNMPTVMSSYRREAMMSAKLIKKEGYALTFADQRYNVRHPDVPSFLYNHQVRFMGIKWLPPTTYLTEWFNARYFRKFTKVIVPDYAGKDNMSGRLSHDTYFLSKDKIHYAGPLADVKRLKVKQDIDYFISISGPEPQRTVFEDIIFKQLDGLKGKIVVTLGRPELDKTKDYKGIEVYPFLGRDKQLEMMQRAKLVICRSGYTTMLELAELGKKALLIPTAGQTEQVYLGDYYRKKGWFLVKHQDRLELAEDAPAALNYPGFPFHPDSKKGVRKLYDELFAQYLE